MGQAGDPVGIRAAQTRLNQRIGNQLRIVRANPRRLQQPAAEWPQNRGINGLRVETNLWHKQRPNGGENDNGALDWIQYNMQ